MTRKPLGPEQERGSRFLGWCVLALVLTVAIRIWVKPARDIPWGLVFIPGYPVAAKCLLETGLFIFRPRDREDYDD